MRGPGSIRTWPPPNSTLGRVCSIVTSRTTRTERSTRAKTFCTITRTSFRSSYGSTRALTTTPRNIRQKRRRSSPPRRALSCALQNGSYRARVTGSVARRPLFRSPRGRRSHRPFERPRVTLGRSRRGTRLAAGSGAGAKRGACVPAARPRITARADRRVGARDERRRRESVSARVPRRRRARTRFARGERFAVERSRRIDPARGRRLFMRLRARGRTRHGGRSIAAHRSVVRPDAAGTARRPFARLGTAAAPLARHRRNAEARADRYRSLLPDLR